MLMCSILLYFSNASLRANYFAEFNFPKMIFNFALSIFTITFQGRTIGDISEEE